MLDFLSIIWSFSRNEGQPISDACIPCPEGTYQVIKCFRQCYFHVFPLLYSVNQRFCTWLKS